MPPRGGRYQLFTSSQGKSPFSGSRPLLPSPAMDQGTRVEVRSRFDDRWSRGFEVAEIVEEGDAARYKLKRRSDGSVLPALFVDDELREEKKRSMWWIA
jgi:hypothetical protein